MTTEEQAPSLADTEKGIIDPNGLKVFRLTMMVITASVCGGVFSLAGDLAAGGANTAAVLISWAICFIGVLSLALVFYGLSRVRPNLTGGIYAYAAAAFGKYVGFNSAWGYWISSCLTNAGYAIMLFSALGYFFPVFGSGNNVPSLVCASAFLWFIAFLVSRGVKEATGVNVIVTIAKLIPLSLFIVSILLLGKFDPAIFMDNFWGEPGGPGLFDQITSTMIALVWIFVGIEGAITISGRAKYVRDVGRATIYGFISVFILYFIISILSMGIMPRAEMAQLATPSMAGVLEAAIGPVGAIIVNLGVILSLVGAMLGYVIIASETPFQAARWGAFPRVFARTNKHGAPIVTIITSAAIIQLFLVLSAAAESTYQFFYTCAVSMILITYVCSALYYAIIAWKKDNMRAPGAPSIAAARLVGTICVLYTIFLVWSCGSQGVMIISILLAPGLLIHAIARQEHHEALLPKAHDKIIAAIIIGFALLSLYLHFSGIAPIV